MNVRPIMKVRPRRRPRGRGQRRNLRGRRRLGAGPSLEVAYKLDDVRDALRAGDVERASRLAERVYRLTPVDVSGQTTGGTDGVSRNL